MESGGGDGSDHGDATATGGNGGERMKIDAYYEEMLKLNPTDALLLRNYGKFLHEVEKDTTRAEEYYGRAILANPSDGELLSLYGALIWETQRDEARAKSYFDQAIHAAPNDWDAPQNGINRASSDGALENTGVRRNLNRTGSCSPRPIIPHQEQFFSDANLHKPSYLGILREDMESGGGDGSDHGDATATGGNGGERMKIDAYYEEMLKLNPTDALLLRNYGKFLHEVEKDTTRAEEYYGRAILANPSDGELLSLYGALIWETQRDEARAKSYFDQAIHAAPNDCTVLGRCV
ncbi:hypothetical protein DEO72_LG4g1752 [Vigna unguiculata]|uniref:TmcB/TmcC TPR repeats domain-containing protein n=1 Tax=Vigna unguiculata TaxID=3917 RepID=A0A4D6LPG1_VIGUN|nr:hypothetical protein DEO72_LG4g1752 [Vigna unguiculata]